MATLARLQARRLTLGNQYYFRNSNAATIIQKWWRSYLGRTHYQLIVKVAYYTMKMNLYNAMAVRIQRRWRGYKVRKYLFNYFYFKEYLRAVSETNDAIREALEEFAEMKDREEKKANLEREEKKRDYQARKMHYLLSTKQIPGIYNSPFRKEPDPWELRLQKAKPLTHRRPRVTQEYSTDLTNWLACTSARSFPQSEILPPIHRKQCQVLAENDESVKKLRKFLPFSSYHKNKKYIPSIHTSSKYSPDSYGKQHFRAENPRKWICDKDFQTVLPSFDLFSKYGKLYSKAGQIV
ncbi:PREDICTED: spermatogenesis-associated protein 17 [Propithecus coquereli]|uniref:spermatogenesis-associated protein 17 n=1 Tax=Propithecus coquereli TaxID=379532 RepID=UPI00063F58AF|nr:PREDICTED: spermatogenesis-associated protein 17 [Propithecus coquereli]